MTFVRAIPVILVCCGIAYNILAIIGALKFKLQRRRPDQLGTHRPSVSILKPIRGRDPGFYEAIRSHATQQYPEFELLFGSADPNDPAIEDIERLQREFPALTIRIVNTKNDAPNGKVGSLEILAREAKYEVMLVNDGDIVVEPDYLARVLSLLEDKNVGLVTALYRATGKSFATKAEALGISTEFAPSVLVARLLSSSGFALGATMAFHKTDLEAIGGFTAIRDYLADDFQLGVRISARGKRVAMADTVVETNLGEGSWSDVWKHQLRWSRTIRVSNPAGYAGYLVTQATFWCVIAAVTGQWQWALAGEAVRLTAGASARLAIGAKPVLAVLAAPFRDLFGFLIWCGGATGRIVVWRGLNLSLGDDGRIKL